MKGRRPLNVLAIVIVLALNLPPVVSTAQPPAHPAETAREKRPAADQVSAPVAQGTGPLQPIVRYAIKNDVSPPLHSLPPIQPESEMPDREIPRLPLPRGEGLKSREARRTYADSALQTRPGPTHMPSPIRSFDGLDNDDNARVLGFRVVPPDTQGDVGPDHYVQWVNVIFAIWDKSGHLLYGPAAGNSLWGGFGGACEATNDGDPITLYDPLADRWLMGQMALPYWPSGPFYQCIAVSTSGDPTGSWYRYQFEWENSSGQDVMNDYPKLAVWPDGYYMTANQFWAGSLSWAGTGVAAFERDQMLNGQTARMVYFDLGPSDQGGMLPADLDGSAPPPDGAPNYLLQAHADEWSAGLNDALLIYEFHVDWVAPANSTFTQVATLPTLPFDGDMCGFSRDCIPQPGTTQRLDAIADRLMHRLPYRNFGAHQTLVANLTVDVDGTDHAGVRWFELRKAGSGWSIYQQGTYAPDADHRWMGSLAMDKVGNIALGYSVSSHSTYPSIRYAGRLAGDPLGVLAQAETELAAGSSFQAGSDRWGDYSMMAVDPADDCTFWYTQEYVPTSGSWGNWDSRIGSFRFPGCLGPTGGLEGVVEETGTGNPIAGAQVTARTNPAYVTYSQPPDGRYGFAAIPTGTYTVTAQAYGYQPQTVAGVDILSGTTRSQDFGLSPAATYLVSGIVTDAATGWPLYASIDIDGYPGAPIWTDPQTGFYSVTLAEGITYTFQVRDFWEGYHVASRDVGPLTGDRTENWALDADLLACTAPGYGLDVPTIYETFDAKTRPPGWRVIDNADTGAVWRFDNPGRAPNNTGGRDNFAIVDSDFEGSVNIDTELRTPVMDLSSLISVTLSFKYDFYWYIAGGDEVADVDVSVDGGSTWINVWTRSGGSDRGPLTAAIDISTIAAGQANVMVRFHYYNANYDWWWQVDDVFIGSQPCSFKSGGLVVGHVYDSNTGGPVVGAAVTNDSGESATASPTPLDPNVYDAFYTIFSPAGPHTFAATMSGGYGSDVRTLTAIEGDVVWQDFHLPAGTLSHAPDSLQVTLDWQASTTVPLTLINDGAEAATFEIREREGGSGVTPLSAADRLHEGGQVHTVAESDEATSGDPASTPAPGADGGPDGFGYVFKDSNEPDGPTYEWVEIAPPAGGSGTAVGLSGIDDGYFWPLDLPFVFNFYGTDYTQVAIASNGTLYFEDDYLGLGNTGIPDTNSYGVYTFIAHFWDNLIVDPGEVYYLFDDDRLIVEYYQVRSYGSYGEHGTWQVILFPTGNILFQYQDASVGGYGDYGASATVGIQGDVVTGLEYSYDTPVLSDELAICFAYPGNPPDCGPRDVPWLSEVPATGTVLAGSTLPVDVTFDAGVPEVTQPGHYYARLEIADDTPYDPLGVPVTMTVSPPPNWGKLNGTVTSLGYCNTNPAPLEGADVFVESSTGMTWTLTTDENGTYPFWLDESYSPLTVTVTFPEHETGSATGVMVANQATTTLDFDLHWLQPCVSSDPGSLAVTVNMGGGTTASLRLNNRGAVSTTFELQESDRGFAPVLLSGSATGHGEWLYRSEEGVPMPSNQGDVALAHPSAYRWQPKVPSRLDNVLVYADDYVHSAPNTFLDQALRALGLAYTAHYDSDWLGFETSLIMGGPWDLVLVGNDSYGSPSTVQAALDTYVHGGGKLIYHSWTVEDDPGHALWTTLGFTSMGNDYDPPGPIYWWEPGHPSFTHPHRVPEFTALSSSLYYVYGQYVEPLSGFEALAGRTTPGPDPNQAALILGNEGHTIFKGFLDGQNDADLDGDGLLDGVELWINLIAGIETGFGSGDVPWLDESPVTGTLAAETGTQLVTVSFDAGVPEITQPGDYLATLSVLSNDPIDDRYAVPITMTVLPPTSWGKLRGTVASLGYCDADPVPLEGADVLIESRYGTTWTLTTDDSGYYSVWLDESGNPFSLTVSAADHETSLATDVVVSASMTTDADLNLRWLQPCITVDPAALDLAALPGFNAALPLTLINDGAAASRFGIHEQDGRPVTELHTGMKRPHEEGQVHTVAESKAAMPDDVASTPAPRASGGPDGFGYVFKDSHEPDGPTYEWVEIAPPAGGSGTALGLHGTDDGYFWPLNLSFPFNFYGTDYTQLAVASNGTIYFEDAFLGYRNTGIPGTNSYGVHTFIAHFWDDLVVDPGEVYYLFDDDRLIIEHYQLRAFGSYGDHGTWQVILFQNGSILFQYQDTTIGDYRDYGASATVGIQGDVVTGLQYSYDTPALSEELAICFAYPGNPPNCQPSDVPWLSEEPASGTVPPDSALTVDVTFTAWPTATSGSYYTATLVVNTDDVVNTKISVPVTMTIVAPSAYRYLPLILRNAP